MDIYVGNIHYHVDENYLMDTFSFIGEVERVTLLKDKVTGRSKGKAFIRMTKKEEAMEAISMLDGSEIKGRKIIVSEAHSNQEQNGTVLDANANANANAYDKF